MSKLLSETVSTNLADNDAIDVKFANRVMQTIMSNMSAGGSATVDSTDDQQQAAVFCELLTKLRQEQ